MGGTGSSPPGGSPPWRSTSVPERPGIGWGAIVVGAIAGIALTGAVALAVLLVAGTSTTGPWPAVVLVLSGFVGQFLAGFVAGRASGSDPALNGAAASLLALATFVAVALGAGAKPGMAGLAFGFVVAGVIGASGGVLAAAWR